MTKRECWLSVTKLRNNQIMGRKDWKIIRRKNLFRRSDGNICVLSRTHTLWLMLVRLFECGFPSFLIQIFNAEPTKSYPLLFPFMKELWTCPRVVVSFADSHNLKSWNPLKWCRQDTVNLQFRNDCTLCQSFTSTDTSFHKFDLLSEWVGFSEDHEATRRDHCRAFQSSYTIFIISSIMNGSAYKNFWSILQ